mgnify:CR=1 FL=1
MSYVYCNRCAHRNPPQAAFCSVCGAVLDSGVAYRNAIVRQTIHAYKASATLTLPALGLADITYIGTAEGWLYLAVVVDLFSRQVVGWSMGSRIDTGLA